MRTQASWLACSVVLAVAAATLLGHAATVVDAVLAEVNGEVLVLSEARTRWAQVQRELAAASAGEAEIS